MATLKRVSELFEERLEKDSPKQKAKAEELWDELPFRFFYLSNADDTVDIVVKSITRKVAKEDGITLPNSVFKNLEDMLGPKNTLKSAIQLVFLTTFR
jgi:hypothetical protein